MVIIVILIILLVITAVFVEYYLLNKSKNQSSESTISNKSTNPDCKENDISNYILDTVPLEGSTFLQRIRYHLSKYFFKEKFTLDSGTFSDKTKLNPNILYRKAKLKTGIKSEISPPLNKGIGCSPYPNEIYVPVEYNLVQFVRVQRITTAPDNVNSINIAEIQVYDLNGNLIPSTSASYSDGGLSGFPATNVNDGNLNNFAHTNTNIDSSGRYGTIGSYIQIGFSSPVRISRIVITNRKDCCQNRMVGTQVQTFSSSPGNTPLTSLNITDTRSDYTIYYSSQKQPIICTGNQVLNTVSGVCECPSTLSFKLNNGSCVAPLTCPSNQIQSRDTGVCVCPSTLSFKLNNGSCVAPLTCPSNQTQSRDTGVCECPSTLSFKLSNGSCVAPLTCPSNQTQSRDTGVCVCPSTLSFKLSNGSCVAPLNCPSIQIQSTVSGVCECPSTLSFKLNNGSCVAPLTCTSGQTQSRDTGVCVCPARQTLINGVCQCPTKEYKDVNGNCQCKSGQRDINGNCICSFNLKMDANGNCYNPCPAHSFYYSYTDSCECSSPYYKSNGTCVWRGCSFPYYYDWQSDDCAIDYSQFM